MSWEERLKNELARPEREEEKRRQEAAKEAKDRESETKAKHPIALDLLEKLGVRNALQGIRRDIWKEGEIVGPTLEPEKETLFKLEYTLEYKHPAPVIISAKLIGGGKSSFDLDQRASSASRTPSYSYACGRGERTTFLKVGIRVPRSAPMRSHVPNDLYGYMAYVRSEPGGKVLLVNLNEPLTMGFYDNIKYPEGFDKLAAAKARMEKIMLDDCVERATKKELPSDLKVKGEAAIRSVTGREFGDSQIREVPMLVWPIRFR
ncbi:MAG: hypothetical protein HYU48_00075 [Candidatus Levybacteria bacterium]|nr:hypothetical protein [Candidatus Levybacteria bacterium]